MPLFCSSNKNKLKKNIVSLENILVLLCESNTAMINAGVVKFSKGFQNYDGWDCDVSSSYENGNIILEINVKDKLDTLIIENEYHDECVVCTDETNQTVKCCNQSICLSCLKKLKKTCEKEEAMSFCCPVCRKDFDNYVTTYNFDKKILSELSDTDQKNEYIKKILK